MTAGAVTPATTVRPSVFNGSVRSLPQAQSSRRARCASWRRRRRTGQIPLRPAPQQPLVANAPAPTPLQNFAGLKRNDTCSSVPCGAGTPPDTNGAVGPEQLHPVGQLVLRDLQQDRHAAGLVHRERALRRERDEPVQRQQLRRPGRGLRRARRPLDPDQLRVRPGRRQPGRALLRVHRRLEDQRPGHRRVVPLRRCRWDQGAVPANTLNDYPKFGIWNDCLYFAFNGFAERRHVQRHRLRRAQPQPTCTPGCRCTGAMGFLGVSR